jgi:hypothetical protein
MQSENEGKEGLLGLPTHFPTHFKTQNAACRSETLHLYSTDMTHRPAEVWFDDLKKHQVRHARALTLLIVSQLAIPLF